VALRAREDVVVALVQVLGPFIGKALVRASVEGHWGKLGLGVRADESDVARVLEAMGPGLNVFVGQRKAEMLVAEAKSALGPGGTVS